MYEFQDDTVLQRGRSGRKNRNGGSTAYNFGDSSIDTDNNDGNSLTYSASSSQAGESTDSSIADITYFLEQQQHMLQQQNAQRLKHHNQRKSFSRENSLGYSTDTNDYSEQGPGQSSKSNEKIIFTAATHGESRVKRTSRPASNNGSGSGRSTPTNSKNMKSRASSFSSPAGVASSDFSSGGGSGSSHTPSSPTPPRHAKKMMDKEGTEMWYAKWWMCGFTDALNLNSKCWTSWIRNELNTTRCNIFRRNDAK